MAGALATPASTSQAEGAAVYTVYTDENPFVAEDGSCYHLRGGSGIDVLCYTGDGNVTGNFSKQSISCCTEACQGVEKVTGACTAHLRKQLIRASDVLGHFSAPVSRFHATCEQFCAGMAFAASCVPCPLSLWKNNSANCLKPGPLGTGLLCRADPFGNAVLEACCETGMPCELPGPPEFPLNARGLRNCGDCSNFAEVPPLFPLLDDSQTSAEWRRQYNQTTGDCMSVAVSLM